MSDQKIDEYKKMKKKYNDLMKNPKENPIALNSLGEELDLLRQDILADRKPVE